MKKVYVIFIICLLAGVSKAILVAPETTHSPNCSISVSASIAGTGGSGGGDSFICLGSSVSLASTVSGGTAPYTYLWTPGMTLSNPASADPVASPTVTTTYTLSVTDNSGCTGTASVTVTVGAPPTIQSDSLLQEYLTDGHLPQRVERLPIRIPFHLW